MKIKSNETIGYYLFLKKALTEKQKYINELIEDADKIQQKINEIKKESYYEKKLNKRQGKASYIALGVFLIYSFFILYLIDKGYKSYFKHHSSLLFLSMFGIFVFVYFLMKKKELFYAKKLDDVKSLKESWRVSNLIELYDIDKPIYEQLIDENNKIQGVLATIDTDIANAKSLFDRRKEEFINKYDNDNDGIFDASKIVNDFEKLLQINQNAIIEVNREYVHQFIKLNEFLKKNSTFINYLFEQIKILSYKEKEDFYFLDFLSSYKIKIHYTTIVVGEIKKMNYSDLKKIAIEASERGLAVYYYHEGIGDYLHKKSIEKSVEFTFEEAINLFITQVYSFEVLTINAINMISALLENDMVTFYKLYEKFDKFEVFESNWQKKITKKLNEFADSFRNLYYYLEEMKSVVDEISDKIDNNFDDLNESTQMLEENLKTIQSSVNTNTLLSGIAAYQSYKTNKKLKK